VIFEAESLLDERIRSFKPDLVLLRGGTIFEAEMGAFLQMIINLRERHKRLPFALDGGQEWLDRTRGDEIPWGSRERRSRPDGATSQMSSPMMRTPSNSAQRSSYPIADTLPSS
jgi:hypothetical protein